MTHPQLHLMIVKTADHRPWPLRFPMVRWLLANLWAPRTSWEMKFDSAVSNSSFNLIYLKKSSLALT